MRSFLIFKKSILLIGIVITFILLILPVFFKKTDDKIHIQFSSWGSESEINILKPIIADFEAENPNIKVDFMHIPQNYFQKIHLLYASNTAPDIIFINNLYLPVYANAGVLEDLSKFNFEYNQFFEPAMNSMKWDGKTYAIPRDVSNLVIFYNKDLFKKYNIPYPKNGWSYKEFINIAKKLTRDGNFGMSFDEGPLYYMPYFVMENRWNYNDTQNYFKSDIISEPKIKKALQNYADLRYKYHCAPMRNELGSMTNGQMFLQGKMGMYLSGRWMVPKLRQDANFDWDVVEFPISSKSPKSSVLTDSSGWAISKSSIHKKEAADFIRFLSSKKSIKKFSKSGLIVPARKDVAYSKAFNDKQKPHNNEAFLNAATTSNPTPVTVNYNEIIDDLKNKTEYIFNK